MSSSGPGEQETQEQVPDGAPVQRTVAKAHRSRWPGWIWGVPIAAVGIVMWLLVRAISSRGFYVMVSFQDATGVKEKSTKVLYRGVDVGQVADVSLSSDRREVQVRLDLDDDLKPDINSGTRFYLQGADPTLSNPASLKAIIAGPTIVIVPGTGKPQRSFTGVPGEPPGPLAASVPYRVTFAGAVGGLRPGSPVMLRGFKVGEVASSELSVDPGSGAIATPVVILLDPTRFHLQVPPPANGDWTAVMTSALSALVQKHLRARLGRDPPLIGGWRVELETVADAAPAALGNRGGYAEIPTVESGGLGDLAQKVGQLPIRQIGDNVRSLTARINELVASPKLDDSIDHLDHSLAELDRTMQQVEPQVGPTLRGVYQAVDSLRKTATQIESTAASARKVIGGNPVAPDGNLQQSLRELEGTARAIRSLAEYLDRHPEALIRGRTGDEVVK